MAIEQARLAAVLACAAAAALLLVAGVFLAFRRWRAAADAAGKDPPPTLRSASLSPVVSLRSSSSRSLNQLSRRALNVDFDEDDLPPPLKTVPCDEASSAPPLMELVEAGRPPGRLQRSGSGGCPLRGTMLRSATASKSLSTVVESSCESRGGSEAGTPQSRIDSTATSPVHASWLRPAAHHLQARWPQQPGRPPLAPELRPGEGPV